MKWNKQQKVLSCVMIAGLIAVSADRLSSCTATADAAVVTEADDLVIAKPAANAVAVNTPSSLSNRLQAATSDSSASRGAFELGSVWQLPEAPAVAVIDPAIEAFTASHKLSATLSRGEHSGAVIDGKLCVLGQNLDGFRLISVTGKTALFASSRSHVTLTQIAR